MSDEAMAVVRVSMLVVGFPLWLGSVIAPVVIAVRHWKWLAGEWTPLHRICAWLLVGRMVMRVLRWAEP